MLGILGAMLQRLGRVMGSDCSGGLAMESPGLDCLGLSWAKESQGLAMVSLRWDCLGLGLEMAIQGSAMGWLRLDCLPRDC